MASNREDTNPTRADSLVIVLILMVGGNGDATKIVGGVLELMNSYIVVWFGSDWDVGEVQGA